MRNKIFFSLCLALIILAVTAFWIESKKSKKQNTSPEVTIGGIFSLTGNGAAYGEPARDGALLAVKSFDASRDVHNKKINLVIEDSQFDPKTALSAYQKLKMQNVHYFLTNGSPVSAVISKEVVKDKNLEYETAAVTPAYQDGKVNTCRAALTAETAGKTIANFVVKRVLKNHGIAFLYAKDEYPQSMVTVISSNLSSLNVPVVATENFGKTDIDFRSQIIKLKSQENSIDMLVVIPLAGQVENVFEQLKELGWNKPIVSDNWTILNKSLKNMSLVEGVYFSNYAWSGALQNNDPSQVTLFKKAFQETYHYDPPVIAALTYDAYMILAKGLTQEESSQPEKVGEWLSNNIKNYQGVAGTVTFNSDCEGNREGTIQVIKNGKGEMVK